MELLKLQHELELHRVELSVQNEELRRANAELQESLSRYAELYPRAPIGYVSTDRHHIIVRADTTAAEILQVPVPSLAGRHLLGYIVKNDHQAYLSAIRSCREPGTKAYRDLNLIRADGSRCRVQAWMVPLHDRKDNFIGWLLTFSDVSAQWSSSNEHRNQIDRLNALLAASRDILAETTVEGLLQRVVEASREITGAKTGVSGHGYHQGEFFVGASSTGDSAAFCGPVEVFKMQRGGVYLEVIEKGHTIRLTDQELRRHPDWWGLPDGHIDLRGLLAAPLTEAEGRIAGLIMVTDKAEGDFNKEDEALLSQLATITSLALQHIQARNIAQNRAKEAEEAKNTLDAIMEHIPEGLTIADAPGVSIRMVSKHGLTLVGRAKEELINRPLGEQAKKWGLFKPDGNKLESDQELPLARAIIYGEVTSDEEVLLQSPEGKKYLLSCNAGPILDKDGVITGGIVAWRDISVRKRGEEALRQSEIKFRTLYESMVQGVLYQNSKGEIVDANPAAEKILGMSLDRLRGMTLSDPVWRAVQQDGSKFGRNEWPLDYALHSGKPVWNVIAGICVPADQAYRWLRISCIPVPRSTPEQPYAVFTTLSDITRMRRGEEQLKRARDELEMKVLERTSELIKANEQLKNEIGQRIQAERASQKGEKLLRSVLETLPVGVIILDDRGQIISINPAGRNIWGGARLVGIDRFGEYKGWWLDSGKLIEPEEWAAARAIRKGETSLEELIEIECFDGTHKIILNWAAPILDLGGKPMGAIIFNQDVSERVKAEQAIRKSENELRTLTLKLLTAQEEERKRIARELHDSTSSSLAGIKYSLEGFACDSEVTPQSRERIKRLVSITALAMQEIRRIMMDLRPSMLDDLGLIATIEWFCRRLGSVYESIQIEKEIFIHEDEVPEPLKIVVFRILQEAVNNAAKYSHADCVKISLTKAGDALELSIADEGVGFDFNEIDSAPRHAGGWGIVGMKERTELTGGAFSIESRPGRGTRVRACWVLQQTTAALA